MFLINDLLLMGSLKSEWDHLIKQGRIPQPGHEQGDIVNGRIPVVLPRLLEEPVVILKLIANQPQGIPCFPLVIQKLQVIHHLRNGSTLFISQIVPGLPVRGCTCHSIHRLCSFLKMRSPLYTVRCSNPLPLLPLSDARQGRRGHYF